MWRYPHAFLWWVNDAPELSTNANAYLAEPRNEIFFSLASVLEMAAMVIVSSGWLWSTPLVPTPSAAEPLGATVCAARMPDPSRQGGVHDVPCHNGPVAPRVKVIKLPKR